MKPKFIAIALLVLILIALGAYWAINKNLEQEAFETFKTTMDQSLGAENWSSQDHSFSLASRSLTVSDVTIDLPKIIGGTVLTQPLTIKIIKVENGLRLEKLQKLLALTDWRDQEDTPLFDTLTLSGLSLNQTNANSVLTSQIDSWEIKNLRLLAADQSNPAGLLGFLSKARLEKSTLHNIAFSLSELNGHAVLDGKISLYELVDPLIAQEVTDPGNYLAILQSLSAAETNVSDQYLKFSNPKDGDNTGNQEFFEYKLAKAQSTGLKNHGKIDHIELKDLDLTIGLNEEIKTIVTHLGLITINGLDFGLLYDRLNEAIGQLDLASLSETSTNYDELFSSLYMTSDILAPPYSLDNMNLEKLSLTLDDLQFISLDSFSFTGPFIAGTIPANQKAQLKDLIVKLPEKNEGYAKESPLEAMYLFGQKFGQTSFIFNYDLKGTNDPVTGLTRLELDKLSISDLFDFSYVLQLSGLTQGLIDDLKDLPMNQIQMALLSSEKIGDISFDELTFTLTDHSLLNKIYAYEAQESGSDAATTKEFLTANAQTGLALGLSSFVENAQAVANEIGIFMNDPQQLVISLKPQPPINMENVFSSTQTQLLNSLHLTLTVNSDDPVTLNFREQDFGNNDLYEDENFEDLDLDDLDLEDLE